MPELEFRDGIRQVPDHVRNLLIGIETYTLTYEQAMKAANDRLLGDRLFEAQAALIRDHFRVKPWE